VFGQRRPIGTTPVVRPPIEALAGRPRPDEEDALSPATAWKTPIDAAEPDAAHPAGVVELGDDDMQDTTGGALTTKACVTATIGLTATICSPSGTLCGSCQMGTRGCC
jgi:hypothetical protein